MLVAWSLLAAPGCAHRDDGISRVRLAVDGDGWADGNRPAKVPLLDIPQAFQTAPPMMVRDVYEKLPRHVVDHRTVVGYVYLAIPPALVDEDAAGNSLQVHINGLGNDWPSTQLASVEAGQGSGRTPSLDGETGLMVIGLRDVPPRSRKLYYTAGRDAREHVSILCRYFDRSHAEYRNELDYCYMDLSPVPNVMASVGFAPHELPLWNSRSERIRTLVRSWALHYESWPENVSLAGW